MKTKLDLEGRNIEIGLMTIMFHRSKEKNLLFNEDKASVQFSSVAQSCLTLCDPRGSSPPGSTVPGILQARTLEWVAISFSNA